MHDDAETAGVIQLVPLHCMCCFAAINERRCKHEYTCTRPWKAVWGGSIYVRRLIQALLWHLAVRAILVGVSPRTVVPATEFRVPSIFRCPLSLPMNLQVGLSVQCPQIDPDSSVVSRGLRSCSLENSGILASSGHVTRTQEQAHDLQTVVEFC